MHKENTKEGLIRRVEESGRSPSRLTKKDLIESLEAMSISGYDLRSKFQTRRLTSSIMRDFFNRELDASIKYCNGFHLVMLVQKALSLGIVDPIFCMRARDACLKEGLITDALYINAITSSACGTLPEKKELFIDGLNAAVKNGRIDDAIEISRRAQGLGLYDVKVTQDHVIKAFDASIKRGQIYDAFDAAKFAKRVNLKIKIEIRHFRAALRAAIRGREPIDVASVVIEASEEGKCSKAMMDEAMAYLKKMRGEALDLLNAYTRENEEEAVKEAQKIKKVQEEGEAAATLAAQREAAREAKRAQKAQAEILEAVTALPEEEEELPEPTETEAKKEEATAPEAEKPEPDKTDQ